MRKNLVTLACAALIALCSCSPNAASSCSSQGFQASGSSQEQAPTALTETAQALSALDGVTSVEPIDTTDPKVYSEKYLVTFEQPLDHKDPAAGTFPQRVEVGIVDGATANIMEVDGYLLMDQYIAMDDAHELCGIANGNYIHVEHRYFGGSVPEGLSYDAVEGWQYLTSENAADDYHRIYTELAKVLDGPWAATGTSRGGEVCASYAYYYPDDMAIYIPYVAPFSTGLEDPRMYEFVYTQIGNEKFGEKQAKEYRDLVTSFQVELMRNKDELAPELRKVAESQGATYRESVSDELLYDMAVLELAVQEWQYSQDESLRPETDTGFSGMSEILGMPDGTDEERQAKLQAELMFLATVSSPLDWSSNFFAWPYYVGAARQYGQYHYDFSYLREACAAVGIPDALSVAPEDEDGFLFKLMFTPEQQEAFTYDGTFLEGFSSWVDTTDTKLLAIYGNSDPWYSLHFPDTNNENVQVYVNDKKPHSTRITDFDEQTSQEIAGIVNDTLYASSDSLSEAA